MSGGLRGLLSFDALLAALAVTALAAVLAAAYSVQSSRAVFQMSQDQRHFDAVSLADVLVSRCPADGGLLKCEAGEAYASELSMPAVERFSQEGLSSIAHKLGISGNASAMIFYPGGGQILELGAAGGVCVRRLALLDGLDVIVQACVS
ncbi:MAG: hypothetical protein V1708_04565 [Candidatus Micrarchaeota archaeon]